MNVHHQGTQKIETERLFLRKFEISDVSNAFEQWMRHPLVQHNYGEPAYETVNEVEAVIIKWIEAYNNPQFYRWCIALKETDECIGQISFYKVDSKNETADIEYCVAPIFGGKGIATEALEAIIQFAFNCLHFNRLQAFHRDANPSSGKVLQKAGMQFEGTKRQYVVHDGQYDDCHFYAIITSDYLT